MRQFLRKEWRAGRLAHSRYDRWVLSEQEAAKLLTVFTWNRR